MKINSTREPRKSGIRRFLQSPYVAGAVVGIAAYLVAAGLYDYVKIRVRDLDLKTQRYASERIISARKARREQEKREQRAAAEQTALEAAEGGGMYHASRVVLDIKFANYQKLAHARQVAKARGMNIATPEDYVPAKLHLGGKTVKVDVRLKGVFGDHWLHPRQWSLRVKVKGNETLFGMKRFSLVRLRARGYLLEWLFTELLRREGILAPRVRYVFVTINGEDRGLYMFEEHFGKRLVESSLRREGPIVGFSKDDLLSDRARGTWSHKWPREEFWAAPVEMTQSSRVVPDSPEDVLMRKAATLLEGFRAKRLVPSEVFDVDKYAALLALRVLFGSEEFDWRDSKFYYNPITSRLEPIGIEAHSVPGRAADWWVEVRFKSRSQCPFEVLLLEDSEFQRAYFAALERVSQGEYLAGLIDEFDGELRRILLLIVAEEPSYGFSWEQFRQTQNTIRRGLHPIRPVMAHFEAAEGDWIQLALANTQSFPVDVESVTFEGGGEWMLSEPVFLPGKAPGEPLEYRSVTFAKPPEAAPLPQQQPAGEMMPGVELRYRMSYTASTGTVDVYRRRWLEEPFLAEDLPRRSPNVEEFPFLAVDEDLRRITVLPGEWLVEKDMILPGGYTVACGAGTSLRLAGGANLVSRSPLELRGTEEEPVVIASDDGTGQGLFVLETGGKSRLEHVVFRGLSAPSGGGWSLTGAVTFYKADVVFENCRFEKNRTGDDLLNTIHCEVAIEGCSFVEALFDAVDWDFCRGTIRDTTFSGSGNDGIDVSGSTVSVERVFITGAGDKGVSVGEDSRTEADEVKIEDSKGGFASKDRSTLTLRNCHIRRCDWGVAAYQKKPEFGAGFITAYSLWFDDVETAYYIERGSAAVLNGTSVMEKAKVEDAKAILYPAEQGKDAWALPMEVLPGDGARPAQ